MNALLCRSLASSFPPSSETPSSLALQATFRHLPGSSLRRRRSNQQFFSNSLSLLTVAPRLGQVMNINKNDYDSVAAQSSSSPSKAVLEIWKKAEAVCFDVDSTVCTDEGLDALGEFCGAGEAVAALTTRAMSGSVPFEEALAARLSLVKPSLTRLQDFIASNPPKITPGIKELFDKLQLKGKVVYLVSGGFRQIIAPVAEILNIPDERIFANRLLFDKDGAYAGFDANEPTSRSGGKAAAIAQIKKESDYNTLVMIGDGATDLEARQPGGANIFICYAGVQFRESVAAQSDWCVFNFNDLICTLD